MPGADRPPHARAATAVCFVAAAVLVILTVGAGPAEVVVPSWLAGTEDGPSARTPEAPPTFGDLPETLPDEPAEQASEPLRIPWQVALVAVLLLAALAAYLVLRRWPARRRRRTGPAVVGGHVDEPLDVARELRDGVRAAGSALDRPDTSRTGAQAVVDAWLALERAAAGADTARAPAQTPSEFTAALLRRHHADEESTTTLLALYHRARFSPNPGITDDDVAAARQALRTMVDTIAPEQAARAGHVGRVDSVDPA
ncbi:uncharacterized protein DUF4129 [Haloactinopolyspora alba]|uniref:Uncharacterized protein DUF4129 n=1 Tax=Haloactinopolyspora alba TaxID=648780 RepID=A0A2P8EBQ0_9ACTN|nr:DUF4129 domain-containing protein [Haloactinopolyspora alba]PSL06898.1 uncharacterized protein DUF4129 [Haloactinopolyspora alba]